MPRALEVGGARRVGADLADEVHQRGAAAVRVLVAQRALGDLGDHADRDDAAADDAEEFSDGGAAAVGRAPRRSRPTVTCEPLTAITRPIISAKLRGWVSMAMR